MQIRTHNVKLSQPNDPYDTAAWLSFYAANPGFRRSVGAGGVNDGEKPDGNEKPDGDQKPDPNAENKPSDKEAELLKDVMKQKEARKAAEAEVESLKKKMEGVDIEEYRQIKSSQEEANNAAKQAEEKRLLDAGEFDKVKEQMVTQHTEALDVKDAENTDLKTQLQAANSTIEKLTVGAGFDTSKFISNETVYTPSDARVLYGGYFDVDGDKVVGYDKPRGQEGRAPIVDGAGNSVGFDDALKRIIGLRSDKDSILTANLKPGSSSSPGRGNVDEIKEPTTSRDKISAGITDLLKGTDVGNDFKLD